MRNRSYWNYNATTKCAEFGLKEIYDAIMEDEKHKKDIRLHANEAKVNEFGQIDLKGEAYDIQDWALTQFLKSMRKDGKSVGFTPDYWHNLPDDMKAYNANYW